MKINGEILVGACHDYDSFCETFGKISKKEFKRFIKYWDNIDYDMGSFNSEVEYAMREWRGSEKK